jgi:hypothetical protein
MMMLVLRGFGTVKTMSKYISLKKPTLSSGEAARRTRTALVRCLKAFTPWSAAATHLCLYCAGKRQPTRIALRLQRSHARRAASLHSELMSTTSQFVLDVCQESAPDQVGLKHEHMGDRQGASLHVQRLPHSGVCVCVCVCLCVREIVCVCVCVYVRARACKSLL